MCDLTEKAPRGTKVKGWKVVIEINGEYFSPATGVKYVSGKRIGKPKGRLVSYFIGGLFNPGSSAFKENMVGRTAIFLHEPAADMLLKELRWDCNSEIHKQGRTLRKISATVSDSVMRGEYGGDPVAAGKRIWFDAPSEGPEAVYE